MRERFESEREYAWIVYTAGALMFGALGGYVLGVQGDTRAGAPAAPVTNAASAAVVVDDNAIAAYRNILSRDPKNRQAAVSAGNMLYDAQRYVEAIPFYQQAFALDPSDVNVSTDLGTALWYSGRPDEALAQYDKSLGLDPRHVQTLLNVGIVRAEGKRDYAGAIETWERLLSSNPNYRDAGRVRDLIAAARQKRAG